MTARRLLRLAGPALLVLALAACGFRPLYGTNGVGAAAQQDLAAVEVGVIADRPGQILRNYLIDRLNPGGRPVDPAYRLNVSLSEVQRDLAIRKDDTATRANLIMNARFTLTDTATGAVVLNRQVGTITSYNILIDEFATLSSERDARDRALQQISEDIRTQLALYFDRQSQAAAGG